MNALEPRYSALHFGAFRELETKGIRDLSESTLELLLENDNFTPMVKAERARRQAPVAPRPTSSGTSHKGLWPSFLEACDLRSPEAIEYWAYRNEHAFTPISLWAKFVVRNEKKRERLEREFDDIAKLRINLEMLLQRFNELEQRVGGANTKGATRGVGGVTWAGVYEANHAYHSGELVTRDGLWLCTADTTTTRPGSDPTAWKLIVHRSKVHDS